MKESEIYRIFIKKEYESPQGNTLQFIESTQYMYTGKPENIHELLTDPIFKQYYEEQQKNTKYKTRGVTLRKENDTPLGKIRCTENDILIRNHEHKEIRNESYLVIKSYDRFELQDKYKRREYDKKLSRDYRQEYDTIIIHKDNKIYAWNYSIYQRTLLIFEEKVERIQEVINNSKNQAIFSGRRDYLAKITMSEIMNHRVVNKLLQLIVGDKNIFEQSQLGMRYEDFKKLLEKSRQKEKIETIKQTLLDEETGEYLFRIRTKELQATHHIYPDKQFSIGTYEIMIRVQYGMVTEEYVERLEGAVEGEYLSAYIIVEEDGNQDICFGSTTGIHQIREDGEAVLLAESILKLINQDAWESGAPHLSWGDFYVKLNEEEDNRICYDCRLREDECRCIKCNCPRYEGEHKERDKCELCEHCGDACICNRIYIYTEKDFNPHIENEIKITQSVVEVSILIPPERYETERIRKTVTLIESANIKKIILLIKNNNNKKEIQKIVNDYNIECINNEKREKHERLTNKFMVA